MVELDNACVIRPLVAGDARAAAALSEQLGYPAEVAAFARRIEELASDADRIALAAVRGDELVAWGEAAVERHLHGDAVAVLLGLVVRDDMRGLGIGRRLCEAIEQWTRAKGMGVLRVRSQIKRVDAHRFYLRDGYRQVKTSLVFEKDV